MTAYPIPDAALDADIAILGRKGGGKTFTAKGIVERLLDMGRRVLVLDPLGVWAGLRTAADGEAPGYPVAIFGGQHGDLPLDTVAAVPMADVLARENVPAVIDLSELTKGAQQSFLLAFLHELRRVNQDALTIVLEEADVFAPQNPQGDDSKQLHHEIDWIARRGRFRGFRLITICQRPARLSKDVLTQAATMIAHRLPAPQDRDAVKAWVEGNGDRDEARKVFDTLARLDVGEAWVWASEIGTLERARFPAIKTLDTSATPKAGEKRIEPKTLADVDLSAIRGALDVAAHESAHISRGKKEIAAPDPAALAAAEKRGYEAGFVDGETNALQAVAGLAGNLSEALGRAETAAADARRLLSSFAGFIGSQAAAERKPLAEREAVAQPDPQPNPKSTPKRQPAIAGGLHPAAVRMVEALGRYPDGLTWDEVCVVSGLVSGNGYFYGGRKSAIEAGAIVEEGNLARPAQPSALPPLTLAEITALWSAKLKAPAPLFLEHLAARGRLSLPDLAAATGLKPGNGYWYAGLHALRKAHLADQDKTGVWLTPLLAAARDTALRERGA